MRPMPTYGVDWYTSSFISTDVTPTLKAPFAMALNRSMACAPMSAARMAIIRVRSSRSSLAGTSPKAKLSMRSTNSGSVHASGESNPGNKRLR